jgi:hypothetical protein
MASRQDTDGVIAVETTEPLVHGSSHGWARIAAAGLLGALGVACLLISPDRGLDNPTYSSQISLARIGWLATCSLAAVIIRPDWRGFVAAWLGALIALMPVVPLYLSHSATTAGNAFWIGTSYLLMAAYAGGALLLASGVTRVVVAVVSPQWARRVLLGLLGGLIVATVTLLVLPAGPDTGPQPAPTAPSG